MVASVSVKKLRSESIHEFVKNMNWSQIALVPNIYLTVVWHKPLNFFVVFCLFVCLPQNRVYLRFFFQDLTFQSLFFSLWAMLTITKFTSQSLFLFSNIRITISSISR